LFSLFLHYFHCCRVGDIGSVPAPGKNEIAVKVLAAAINPSDINMIEGTYGTLPKLPATAGKECVARVSAVGADVKGLAVGDHVISGSANFGAWCTEGVAPAADFLKVPAELPVPYAATLHVNPCTAYRMLRDFKQLKPGDVVIQNAANSMVGMAVVQMAREMGLRTINVVRADRPNAEDTLRLLDNLGGTVNVLDTWVNTPSFQEMCRELPPISLALNGVGGASATELLRALAPGGTLVTYGGMSKVPMEVPADLVKERNLKLEGFWVSKWHESAKPADREAMLADIARMVLEDKLSFFFEMHDFDDFSHALASSMQPFRLRKTLLNMDYPDRLAEHDALPAQAYERFSAGYDV
jgi:mitochondrial enoyl-[acyl-carrier protein] reductase / trans-2-enoyl-CoA reductase